MKTQDTIALWKSPEAREGAAFESTVPHPSGAVLIDETLLGAAGGLAGGGGTGGWVCVTIQMTIEASVNFCESLASGTCRVASYGCC